MSQAGHVLPLVAAGGFVVVAGLLAGAEVALSRTSRIAVDEMVSDGIPGAPRLKKVLEEGPKPVNLLLLLRLLCEVAAVVVATRYFDDRIGGAGGVAVVVAAMTALNYVLVGVAPRTIGRQHSARIARVAAGPVLLLMKVLGPLPSLLILLGNAITPGRGFREGPFASEAELRDLVERAQRSGVVEQSERDMIESVFELGDTIVREVMVPRTDIVVIERTKTVKQALNLLLRSGFSRIPVVGENSDDVVGLAYLRDLVKKERTEGGGAVRVDEVMRKAVFVPESKPVDELLREMQTELGHIAIVVDEYGGTAGLVTLEDIVEEVVGEITDEYDREAPAVEPLNDGSVRVTARLPIEDLEELYGVELPHEDVDSVGGLMASLLGRVPIPGATVEASGLVLVAESSKGRRNRIGTVLVRRVEEEDTDEPE
jgi:CBS domain containing-hemolysin-like protein